MIYVPKGSLRDTIIKETHEEGLLGHFRAYKTWQ